MPKPESFREVDLDKIKNIIYSCGCCEHLRFRRCSKHHFDIINPHACTPGKEVLGYTCNDFVSNGEEKEADWEDVDDE